MMAPDLYARSIQDSSTGGRFNLREKKMAGPSQSSRLCFCLIHTMLLGGLVSAGALAAQEPPKESATQDSGILLRQTVRRVRVDVVVIDAQGHPVKGLQASDFRVAEDGKPQSIRQFEYRSDENAETTLPKRPPLPPHTFMNLPAAPEHGPLTSHKLPTPSARADAGVCEEEQRPTHRRLVPRRPASNSAGFYVGHRFACASSESNRRFFIEGL